MNPNTDLINLMLGTPSQSSGKYDHLNWSINLNDDSHGLIGKITSIHEALHSELNNSTPYGLLLIITAYLARNRFTNHQSTLNYLVAECRFAHETYATYLSCNLMEQAGARGATTQFEASFPAYSKYLNLGRELLPRSSNGLMKQLYLSNLIKFCFRTPFVLKLSISDIIDGFLPRVTSEEFPDSRLEKIISIFSNDVWREHIKDLNASEHVDAGLIDFFDHNKEFSEIEVPPSEVEHFHSAQEKIDRLIYERMQSILIEHKLPVCSENAHLAFLERIVPQINEYTEGQAADAPLKISPHDDETFTLKSYETEVLVISHRKLRVDLMEFKDTPRAYWDNFLSGGSDTPHFFIVSRIIERMKQDYDFSKQDLKILENYRDGFIVGLRNLTWDQHGKIVQICLFDNPNQLHVINKITKAKMLSNTSMLLAAHSEWQARWHDTINDVSTHTMLFDLSPFIQIEQSFPSFCSKLKASKIWYSEGNFDSTALLLMGTGNLTTLSYIICSEIAASAILDYLSTQQNALSESGLDFEISTDLPDDIHLVNRLLLPHLFSEETTFDFGALNSQLARQGFKNEQFVG